MFDGDVNDDGWVAWRMLPSTLYDPDVSQLENEFKIQLPPLFRAYLLAGFQLFDQIHSLRYEQLIFNTDVPSNNPLGPTRDLIVAWQPLLSARFVPFAEWGDGWGPMCFDAENRGEDGDCPIVWMDHELLFRLGEEKCGDRDSVLPHVNPLYSSYREFFDDTFSEARGVGHTTRSATCDVTAPSEFFNAAREGMLSDLERPLSDGVPINSVNAGDATALEMAAEAGQLNTVQLLLDYGATPNPIGDEPFSSALISASTYDHVNVVRLLLEHGADPNFQDWEGQTALIWAAGHGCSIEIIEALLAHGALTTTLDKQGATALDHAELSGDARIVALLDR